MELKEIISIEVVGDVALSAIDADGVSYMVKDADTSAIVSGTKTEIVTDFTINDGVILWRGQTINLNK